MLYLTTTLETNSLVVEEILAFVQWFLTKCKAVLQLVLWSVKRAQIYVVFLKSKYENKDMFSLSFLIAKISVAKSSRSKYSFRLLLVSLGSLANLHWSKSSITSGLTYLKSRRFQRRSRYVCGCVMLVAWILLAWCCDSKPSYFTIMFGYSSVVTCKSLKLFLRLTFHAYI